MTDIIVYSTGNCPICDKAKASLKRWKVPFSEVRIDLEHAHLKEYSRATNGARTVPQIIVGGVCIGGYSELTELHMDGELEKFASD